MESAFGVDHGNISKVSPYLVGAPIAASMDAPKGKKSKAYADAYGAQMKHGVKGAGVGAAVGTVAGLGAAIASKGKLKPVTAAGAGAGIGAAAGLGAGGALGQGASYNEAKQKGGW